MKRLMLALSAILSACAQGEFGQAPEATLGGKPAVAMINFIWETPNAKILSTVSQGSTSCQVWFHLTTQQTSHPAIAECADGRAGTGHAQNSRPFGEFDLHYVLNDGTVGYVRVAPVE